SWGENFLSFNELFFYHFPGYNKFRAVSMILTIAQFTMPLLALLAMKEIFEGKTNKNDILKSLKMAFYITGGFCLLFTLLPGMFNDFSSQADEQLKQYDWLITAIKQDRESAVRMDALRSLFFIAATFGLLWFMLKDKIKASVAVITIAVLFIVDLWPVGKRYLNDNNFVAKSKTQKPFEPTAADTQILQDTTPGFRVLNTTLNAFSDASTSYFHRSIGGYHGAKLKRYQELIENCISKNNMSVLDMLNTKYLIVSDKGQQPVAQLNPGAIGAAWFVDTVKTVENADAEIKALENFNPRTIAFVDKRFENTLKSFAPQHDSTATIKLNSIVCNHLVYETQTALPQFCVFSEIYYDKGWNAYIDGQKADYVRANYVLRAMAVPAGKHKIEFKFEPEVYFTGEKISLAGSIVLLLLFAAGAWIEVKSGTDKK
ncbi:MAG TPA: YfhO family protein, partial [Bacteroidia bacterium]|nr:YfhO family protein [Bacteroidia bacterium]